MLVHILLAAFVSVSRADSVDEAGAKETVISKTAVTLPLWRAKDPQPAAWAAFQTRFQKLLVDELNFRSYLTALPVGRDVSVSASSPLVQAAAQSVDGDSVLLSEVQSTGLRFALRGRLSGRPLQWWILPTPPKWDENTAAAAASTLVQLIVKDLPYKGYVMFVAGDRVQLNLGNKFSIRKGMKLTVFEFEGNDPTFSSPKKGLAELMVEQTSQNLAAAKITRKILPLHKFAKVDILVETAEPIQTAGARYDSSWWISAGPEFVFLDTQTPDDANLKKRKFKLTLSPFLRVAGGYNRWMFSVSSGSADNASNEVGFLYIATSYEVFRFPHETWSVPLSLGIEYSSFSVKTKADGTAPLTSTKTTSPYIEQAFHVLSTENSRFFFFGQAHFPLSSTDDTNGTGSGFALALGGGVRVYVTPKWGFEGALRTRYGTHKLSSGSVQELQYGLSVMTGYYF